MSGGWGGIRTHETLARLPVFKTGALDRSATHPYRFATRQIRFRAQGVNRETGAPA